MGQERHRRAGKTNIPGCKLDRWRYQRLRRYHSRPMAACTVVCLHMRPPRRAPFPAPCIAPRGTACQTRCGRRGRLVPPQGRPHSVSGRSLLGRGASQGVQAAHGSDSLQTAMRRCAGCTQSRRRGPMGGKRVPSGVGVPAFMEVAETARVAMPRCMSSTQSRSLATGSSVACECGSREQHSRCSAAALLYWRARAGRQQGKRGQWLPCRAADGAAGPAVCECTLLQDAPLLQ